MIKAINHLGRHVDVLKGELEAAIIRVLDSGWFILGPEVAAFESAFAAYCGTAHCVAVANGTDAIELALRALGVESGGNVATVANAGMYSSTAILAAGATPVYVDVDPETMLIDLDRLEIRIAEERLDAVIATHLFGLMVDMPRLAKLCRDRDIALIEDCAQAHGAMIDGTKAGAFADAGCFSFYPTKNLGALGDGGAVVTSIPEVAEKLRCLRQYGWTSKYASRYSGGRNSRLDEMQAAVLSVLLPHLDRWNVRRREIACAYSSGIRNARIQCPKLADTSRESYVAHLYVVRAENRDGLKSHLVAGGIPFDLHYPIPDHRQQSIQERLTPANLPATERLCSEVITLPCFPEMTDAEIAQVIECVNHW